MVIWPKGKPKEKAYYRWRCRSWRHEGDCARWRGAQDFVRIKEAMEGYPNWLYAVLTFDPTREKTEWGAYRGAIHKWARLRKSLERRFGKLHYVQTWEKTQKGWPHVNLVLRSDRLIAAYREDRVGLERALKALAARAGFGWRIYLEEVRDTDSMAGYAAKLAREFTGSTEKGQVPVNAPPHFRRLRASRGLLPPPHRSGKTGMMIFHPLDSLLKSDIYVTDPPEAEKASAGGGRLVSEPRSTPRWGDKDGHERADRHPVSPLSIQPPSALLGIGSACSGSRRLHQIIRGAGICQRL